MTAWLAERQRISGKALAAALGGAILVSGCATLRGEPRGSELVGRTLRMETARGDVTNLRFRDDGTVQANFRRGSLVGRWRVERRRLCFYWTGAPRECWPYREPFIPGRTRAVTSDRGNALRVTMI